MRKISYIIIIVLFAAFGTGCAREEKQEDFLAETEQMPEEVDATEQTSEEAVDYSEYFQGLWGCAVLGDESGNAYSFYNKEQCEKEATPLSTFKIVSALAGLEYGVLSDENTVMEYNGTEYPVAAWNGELTLKEAFGASCVWYFRQVADRVGQEKMLSLLKELQYGNRDISAWEGGDINPLPELNGFWLDSSLKISPLQQVESLKYIFTTENNFNEKSLETLKEIMYVTELEQGALYGKTGSGAGKAWFVGFLETNGNKIYFAIYLEDAENTARISGDKAKEIAVNLLKGEV